ncbi:MAG: 30S ribosomal protein S3 [Fimbriimonadaceae bacterium]|nr:30S ribosomal protein S3 [Fimbriimonadaceae bacterium]
MGQKIHPVGFRVGVIRGFDSHWYFSKKGYGPALLQDHKIRNYIKGRVGLGNVSRVEIERAANRVKVTIFTARPGAIIGRGGKGIDELTDFLNRMIRRTDPTNVVQVNVTEVRQPELDAQLVAENICQQLEKRISHRRAMRQAMTRCMRMNGRGIKVQVSGRLGGSEIARTEGDKVGKIPLHTIRADIDYGVATAHTVYGSVGCKVWIYKGEVLPERRLREMDAAAAAAPRKKDRSDEAIPPAFAATQAEIDSAPAAIEAAPVPVVEAPVAEVKETTGGEA